MSGVVVRHLFARSIASRSSRLRGELVVAGCDVSLGNVLGVVLGVCSDVSLGRLTVASYISVARGSGAASQDSVLVSIDGLTHILKTSCSPAKALVISTGKQ